MSNSATAPPGSTLPPLHTPASHMARYLLLPAMSTPSTLCPETAMAILQEQRSQQSFYLGSQHLFGRNRKHADTVLDNPDASQSHATISWTGTGWEITDHSHCGTLINDKLIPPHTSIALAVGETLSFASGATQRFKVLDLDRPRPMLLPLADKQGAHRAAIALHSRHCLPDQTAPQAVVRRNEQGQWFYEDANGHMLLDDGDTIQVAGQDWMFFNRTCDCANLALPVNPGLAATQFNFKVSQNEEHVRLAVLTSDTQIDLGERSHHYGLLTLARKRLLDAQAGFDTASQGWIRTERFAAMLGVDEPHANMLLYRARQQISKQNPGVAQRCQFVERRRGELRFASFGFQIVRGCRLEAVFNPGK